MTIICTEDGVWIHPQYGTIAAATREEAMREIARRKEAKRGRRA